MVSLSLVLGYHGCERSVAERVIAGGDGLRTSRNRWEWLGHGIYFWEDSPARALRWAKEGTRKIKQPAVVGAVIQLGHCLNLADAEALGYVKAAHDAYRETCRASDVEPAQNRDPVRSLDCAVIETLHGLREKEALPAFDTVRGFFMEGQPVYPEAGFRELDHVQICVRNPRQIIGYFRPLTHAAR